MCVLSTDLLVDSLVLEMMRRVSPVQPHLVLATAVILHLEPDPALVLVLPLVTVLALHTHTPAAATPRQPGVAGVAVLSPGHQRGWQLAVSKTALSGQLSTVPTMCSV